MTRIAIVMLGAGLLLACQPRVASAESGVRSIEADSKTQTAKAVVVDQTLHLVHTAQLLPYDAEGASVIILDRKSEEAQADDLMDNLESVLKHAHSGLDRLIKVNVYAANLHALGSFRTAFARRMAGKTTPAIACVMGRLPDRDAVVALDAVAATTEASFAGAAPHFGSKPGRGQLPCAPFAVLPAGGRVYVSGQAETDKDLTFATRKTLAGLATTLKFLGLEKSQVVQAKAFLQPMVDVAKAQAEVVAFFGADHVPPLVFVEWTMGQPIEIELVVASKREDGGDTLDFLTPPQLKPSPVFCRVVRVNRGDSIYVSGLYGPADANGKKQVESVFTELKSTIEKAGSDLRHLVKATYYVSEEDSSRALNELRPKYYDPARPPAASKAAVVGVGLEGRSLMLDMIAVPAARSKE